MKKIKAVCKRLYPTGKVETWRWDYRLRCLSSLRCVKLRVSNASNGYESEITGQTEMIEITPRGGKNPILFSPWMPPQ